MIRLENVSKYYHDEKSVIKGLININLTLNIGEFVAITGESGSGKSTLLNVISGIDTYEEGELYINNEQTSYFDNNDWEEYRRNYIGFIFQNYNLIDSYTVLQNVMTSLIIQGKSLKEAKAKAKEVIEKVGLKKYIYHKATKLSGGQKQRLAIARALAKETKIIVADEPTGNLDSESGKSIIKLLHEISKDKLVVIVTHNYEEVEEYVTRKIRLYDGKIVEDRIIKNNCECSNDNHQIKQKEKNKSFSKAIRLSIWNLLGQPKRTIFMLIVSLVMTVFMAFFFILFLYSYNLNDSFEYTHYFENNYDERIVITKKDKTIITEEDITKLNNITGVVNINTSDYIIDKEIFIKNLYYSYYLNKISLLNKNDIIYGRFPENKNEVVVAINIDEKTFENEYENRTFRLHDELPEYVIVGLTNSSYAKKETLFINDDEFDSYYAFNKQATIFSNFYVGFQVGNEEIYNKYYDTYKLIINENIDDDMVIMSKEIYDFYTDITLNKPTSILLDNHRLVLANDNGQINTGLLEEGLYVNSNTYNKLLLSSKQASITMSSKYLVDSAKEKLENLGYYYVVPSELKQKINFGEMILMYIFFFISCAISLLMIFIVGYFVLKVILLAKKKDYTILRSIGVNKKTILLMSKFELLIIFTTSYLLFLVMYFLFKNLINDYEILKLLANIKLGSFIIIYLLDILLSLLVSRKYNKLLMKKSLLTNMKEN